MDSSWINPNIEIRPSSIQGRGMFANADFGPGEKLIIWGGKGYTTRAHAAVLAQGQPTMQWDDDLFSYEVGGEDDSPFLINHSCDPNAWMSDAFTITARRAIKAGEEITADHAMWEADEEYVSAWGCCCGSTLCRKVITGRDWRIPELQEHYRGHFSPLLNKRILRNLNFTFYFMRHAQTDAHAQRLICGGEWDLPLNADGIKQAELAAMKYRNALSSVKKIYCSPLLRAQQTAQSLSNQLTGQLSILHDLREWLLGDWDRKPWNAIPDLFTRTDAPPNGESIAILDARVANVLFQVSKETEPVLIISHGAVWYSVLRNLGLAAMHIASCAPHLLRKHEDRWECTPVEARSND